MIHSLALPTPPFDTAQRDAQTARCCAPRPLPSFLAAASLVTHSARHPQDIPPQYGPGYGSPAGTPFSAAIDGQGPSGWRLPLPELDATSTPEPFYLAGGQPVDQEAARHEAAAKLAGNREKVLMFALRGAGTKGAKRFQVPAPLTLPEISPHKLK